ncbi:MAG TPA: hemin uptake protein HemP [Burkholderiaceae bacterium]|nr:hemin uptake protein HemP [Burkholderiaceae bacterium]
MNSSTLSTSSSRATTVRSVAPSALDSRQLLHGAQVVQIHHRGETYVLRETRLGKLILTK